MNIIFYIILKYGILLLIVISCLYTSLALAISAIEHIKEFRGNNGGISPNCEGVLWHDAQGDYLPIYEREVIVLYQPYPLENSEYVVSFAHRPNPNGWDGKSLMTGKKEHYTPKTYGKGGWSIPDVVWWLDCPLPKCQQRGNCEEVKDEPK